MSSTLSVFVPTILPSASEPDPCAAASMPIAVRAGWTIVLNLR
jgi:hypothetical protein